MKKIGIVTFHRAYNYGAVIQNYALQFAVSQLGYLPVTIDYRSRKIDRVYKLWPRIRRIHLLYPIITGVISNIVNLRNAYKQRKGFDRFRKEYLNIDYPCDSDNIRTINFDINAYICGSDQIWSSSIISNEDVFAYTLAFVDGVNKSSYGASVGSIERFNTELVEQIRDLSYITVRECELKDLLYKYGIESKTVCDPVFLPPFGAWKSLINNALKRPFNYVFLYYIESGKELAVKIAKKVSRINDLKVLYPRRYEFGLGFCAFDDDPIQFLADIYYSSFVVVSSFHGLAFAILFEKPFVVILHDKTQDRAMNLLSYLGLENRIVEKDTDIDRIINENEIEYSKIREKIQTWRNHSLEELKRMCQLADNN